MQSIRLLEAEERKTHKKLDRPYDYTFNRTLHIFIENKIFDVHFSMRRKNNFFLGG